jgi:enamine deaminase RidA (YjgF/YER057c/UK114 family)
MAKQHIQPEGLFPSKNFGFTQVVTSPPGTQVFISGQVAWNENFELVGGSDLAAQAEQALANLGLALTSAGASAADITMLRIYVAGYTPKHAMALGPPLAAFFGGSPPPAQTLLGVETLAAPDLLIEIEALAVIAA